MKTKEEQSLYSPQRSTLQFSTPLFRKAGCYLALVLYLCHCGPCSCRLIRLIAAPLAPLPRQNSTSRMLLSFQSQSHRCTKSLMLMRFGPVLVPWSWKLQSDSLQVAGSLHPQQEYESNSQALRPLFHLLSHAAVPVTPLTWQCFPLMIPVARICDLLSKLVIMTLAIPSCCLQQHI